MHLSHTCTFVINKGRLFDEGTEYQSTGPATLGVSPGGGHGDELSSPGAKSPGSLIGATVFPLNTSSAQPDRSGAEVPQKYNPGQNRASQREELEAEKNLLLTNPVRPL